MEAKARLQLLYQPEMSAWRRTPRFFWGTGVSRVIPYPGSAGTSGYSAGSSDLDGSTARGAGAGGGGEEGGGGGEREREGEAGRVR